MQPDNLDYLMHVQYSVPLDSVSVAFAIEPRLNRLKYELRGRLSSTPLPCVASDLKTRQLSSDGIAEA